MSTVNKFAADRNQRILLDLVQQPGNDICADCKTRSPRWASWNIGIFICVQCAAVHRKLGVHVSKVKSVNMDAWSKEQVEIMKTVGNIKSNTLLNPDEARNPPPVSMDENTRDSDLERYIRDKYEFKRFIRKAAPPSQQRTPPRATRSTLNPGGSPVPPPKDAKYARTPSRSVTPTPPVAKSASLPSTASSVEPPIRTSSQPYNSAPAARPVPAQPNGGTAWNDLISLQGPTQDASLPVQIAVQPMPTLSLSTQMHQSTFTGAPSFSMTGMSAPAMQSSSSMFSASPYSALNLPSAPAPSFLSQPQSQFTPSSSPALSTSPIPNAMMSTPGSFHAPSSYQPSPPAMSPSPAGYFQQQQQPGSFASQTQFTPQLQQSPPPIFGVQSTGLGLGLGLGPGMGMAGMNGMSGTNGMSGGLQQQSTSFAGSNNPFGASAPSQQFQPSAVFQQMQMQPQQQQPMMGQPQQQQQQMYFQSQGQPPSFGSYGGGTNPGAGWQQPPQQAWGSM